MSSTEAYPPALPEFDSIANAIVVASLTSVSQHKLLMFSARIRYLSPSCANVTESDVDHVDVPTMRFCCKQRVNEPQRISHEHINKRKLLRMIYFSI
jgi:hypothetical protein